jgi:hypothetical protein
MRWLLLFLPAVLLAVQPRFARVGEFEGAPEIQVRAAEPWQAALRNTPLVSSSRIRCDATGRIEIELEEGSALRLAGDSLAELSDYSRLSTGQRITLITVDRGVAYFTGEPRPHDIVSIALPGAQILLKRGSRVRLEATDQFSQIAVIEGLVRFATSSAEIEVREGQMARVAPGNIARFSLYREITALDTDRWSDQRDKAENSSTSRPHLPGVRYGAVDLDLGGSWIQTEDYGVAWKPKVADGWAPFQSGKWVWYEELGYTWIAAEAWGWSPYHHGRWMQDPSLGWIWAPGASAVFKPGEVYWMRGSNLAAWGPLAPNEAWTGAGPAVLFAGANSTLARFAAGAREFAPDASIQRPKDLLSAALFTVALPSPAFAAARLDAVNTPLRAQATTLMSAVEEAAPRITEPPRPIAPQTPAPQVHAPRPSPPLQQPPLIVEVLEPYETYYPVPVYSGVIVVNPPNKTRPKKKPHEIPNVVTP